MLWLDFDWINGFCLTSCYTPVFRVRYFPRRSNQTNQLFLEDILLESLLAHLKVTWQLNINIRSHGTIIRFRVQSLSVGKYYTSLLKSHICNNYCCIYKEINILHYDGKSSKCLWYFTIMIMAAPSSCLHYDITRVISDRGCELQNMEFQIYFLNF